MMAKFVFFKTSRSALTAIAVTIALAACGGGSSEPIPPAANTNTIPSAPATATPAASPTVSPTPLQTATPTAAGHVFIADSVSTIYEFALPLTSSSTPVAKLTAQGAPYGMAFDRMNRLFVASATGVVQVFVPPIINGASPSFTLNARTSGYIAVDSSGNAYALTTVSCGFGCENPVVEKIAAPVNAASIPAVVFTISNHVSARGLSFDAKGNLWTAEVFHTILGISCALQEFSPPFSASTSAAQTIELGTCDGEPFGVGLAFDRHGNLFVNDANGNIDTFTISSSGLYTNNYTPFGAFIGAYGLAFDKQNTLYATTATGLLALFFAPFPAANAPALKLVLPGNPPHAGVAVAP